MATSPSTSARQLSASARLSQADFSGLEPESERGSGEGGREQLTRRGLHASGRRG